MVNGNINQSYMAEMNISLWDLGEEVLREAILKTLSMKNDKIGGLCFVISVPDAHLNKKHSNSKKSVDGLRHFELYLPVVPTKVRDKEGTVGEIERKVCSEVMTIVTVH